MKQVNAHVFYLLGSRLQALLSQVNRPARLLYVEGVVSIHYLDMLMEGTGQDGFRLDESREYAAELVKAIVEILQLANRDAEALLSENQVATLKMRVKRFDAVLGLELGRAPIFYVTPKGVLSTRRLISDAAVTYEGYRNRLPDEAIADTIDARPT